MFGDTSETGRIFFFQSSIHCYAGRLRRRIPGNSLRRRVDFLGVRKRVEEFFMTTVHEKETVQGVDVSVSIGEIPPLYFLSFFKCA